MDYSKLNRLTATILLIAAPGATASADGPTSDPARSAELQDVIANFKNLSKLYRRSGEEEKIRDFLIERAKANGLHFETDSSGNLSVDVPGVGPLAHSPAKIALQAHMDMVFDVAGLEQGADARPYFKNGVDVVEENGSLHSRNHKTTLGADDGAGIALLMRYMSNQTLAHPPLKLYFTTEEETGLKGAAGLKIPEDIKAFVNVDNETYGDAAIGCLGFAVIQGNFSGIKSVPVAQNSLKITVSMSGMQGGHSGLQIHQGRANAAKIQADLILGLQKKFPEMVVLSASAGEGPPQAVFNKIPNSFRLEFAVPRSAQADVEKLIAQFTDSVRENYKNVEKNLESSTRFSSADSQSKGIAGSDAARLAQLVRDIPNGVITNNPAFTNGMDLSSNTGFFKISPATKTGDTFETAIGVMPRSFTESAMDGFVPKVANQFKALPYTTHVDTPSRMPAWTPDNHSWILPLLRKRFAMATPSDKLSIGAILGGLELAPLFKGNPKIPMVSIGPTIQEAHSHMESLDINSLQKLINLTDGYINDLGQEALARQASGAIPDGSRTGAAN